MTQDFIVSYAMEAVKTALLLSGPMLLFALITGLLISIIQAAASVHEPTLTFVPKIFAVFLALILFLPWLVNVMAGFASNIFENFPNYIG